MKNKSSISLRNILKGFNKKKRRNNNTQEQNNPPLPHERHGTTSDKISVIVNTVLAVFTLVAIYFAYQANQTSIDSLKYAKLKDSLENIEQVKKDFIDSSERDFNRRYVDSTLYISSQSVDAAKKSSQISEKALKETQKNYEFSRESAMKELRAYEAIVEIKAVNFKKDSIVYVEAKVTNVGKTPAYKFRCEITFMFGASQDKVNIEKSFDALDKVSEISVGASQSTFHNNKSKEKIRQDVIDIIKDGKIKMFAAVRISYYDIFNMQHFTHGFYEYDIFKEAFNICLRYNDSD